VTVAGRGGWSSPAVPMKVYGHFAPARDQAAAASLAHRLEHEAPGEPAGVAVPPLTRIVPIPGPAP
jgi:hypothetical protein